jgi:hypothetical protein
MYCVFTTTTKCRRIAIERNNTEKQKRYTHLTFTEREEIYIGLSFGNSILPSVSIQLFIEDQRITFLIYAENLKDFLLDLRLSHSTYHPELHSTEIDGIVWICKKQCIS